MPLPGTFPSISEEDMMDVCNDLSRRIQPEDTDDERTLHRLWSSIYYVLLKQQDTISEPATKEEFLKKVERYPREDFLRKVKETSSAKSETRWARAVGKWW
jgi:hypothetical protein